ncbi:lipase 3-like [Anoplophora glabripennis]|uniref:lipase 3-like n=1 Tax=Anoplophora glabripennis TaxID=217634 RepID=UPI000C7603A7|nr:lipase 3-like [Anoplophora glabripennis]
MTTNYGKKLVELIHKETGVIAKYIAKYGYPAETHKIVTEDGYILKTHRIPHGKASSKTNNKVVLLVHGIAGSAENFIILGPNDALAFLLADRGFDVWLFNARGTVHSRRHETRSPNYFQASGFWNFNLHEIGVYDLPANIDYILESTNNTFIFYVGHSQAGASYVILTSEKPEYNQKIRAAALLAPAVLMQYTESYFRRYDYEKSTNLIKYNNTFPPEYNINNSVVPVALFMANGDNLISMKSIYELSKLLPNVAMIYEVPHENFNHIDYLFAHNAKDLIYEPVYDFIMQFMDN